MNWAELQAQAQAIVGNVLTGDFRDESFTTRSGGCPANALGLPEVHRSEDRRYNTVRNGWAYSGELVIRCRDTGAKDHQRRTIWETPEGVLFVFRHCAGSPESFDTGCLISPQLVAS